MNKQTVFNKVVKHLLSMKQQSIKDGDCQYLAEDGNKCAIGCLIPKRNYDPSIEGEIAILKDYSDDLQINDEVFRVLPVKVRSVLESDLSFTRELQNIHDRSLNWTSKGIRRSVLRAFAKAQNLEYPK